MKYFLGIDPGASGAWVILDERGRARSWGLNTEYALFLEILPGYEDQCLEACVEQVGAMPHQGVTSMFTFGRECGMWDGMLLARNIPSESVLPREWQKSLSLPAKTPVPPGEDKKAATKRKAADKKARKEAITAHAVKKWPELAGVLSKKKNQGLADAAYIALHMLRRSLVHETTHP